VLTVGADQVAVERGLREGTLGCPCGGVLAPWGWARPRLLRDLGSSLRMRPRRSRCRSCAVTHVLLLVDALLRRADTVAVIGSALADKAQGRGHRVIAARLGRPASTVRGWLRRFGSRAESVRAALTALAVTLVVDAVLPEPAGGVFADAVSAVGAAASAAARRFGVAVVSGWRLASSVTAGRLLAPGWPDGSCNTSWPWAAVW
jgi:Homeodomain-like domain